MRFYLDMIKNKKSVLWMMRFFYVVVWYEMQQIEANDQNNMKLKVIPRPHRVYASNVMLHSQNTKNTQHMQCQMANPCKSVEHKAIKVSIS